MPPTPEQAQAQSQLIIDGFAELGTPVEALFNEDERPATLQYHYRQGHILVRDEYLDRVRELLGRAEFRPAAPAEELPVVRGITLLPISGDALRACELVRDGVHQGPPRGGLGAGVCAPDHVVSISGDAGSCPASEPEVVSPLSAPDPAVTTDRAAGEGIRVVVVDTGLDQQAVATHPWLAGVVGDPDPAVQPPSLGPYAGHGTFIAGVVRTMAPQAEVIVRAVFRTAGAIFESDLVRALDEVLERDFPDVISMSAGTRTFNATGLLSFQVFHETRLRHHKGIVMVTAAGNDGARNPFWPAAAPWTVSVGALASKWRGRASFSNYGGWVDVYAPGQDLVNAYPTGTYMYQEPPLAGRKADFDGMARWSGTSFSTPMVAGLIAARMSHTGQNGRDAATALVAAAQSNAQPGVGAVLLPDQ